MQATSETDKRRPLAGPSSRIHEVVSGTPSNDDPRHVRKTRTVKCTMTGGITATCRPPAFISSMDPLMGTAALRVVDDFDSRISAPSPVPTMCLTGVFSSSLIFIL